MAAAKMALRGLEDEYACSQLYLEQVKRFVHLVKEQVPHKNRLEGTVRGLIQQRGTVRSLADTNSKTLQENPAPPAARKPSTPRTRKLYCSKETIDLEENTYFILSDDSGHNCRAIIRSASDTDEAIVAINESSVKCQASTAPIKTQAVATELGNYPTYADDHYEL
ncbi:unnamed protein product [Dibothriocephalus latus]|uniref:Uncharacterized protein n=1 Tax=Dibothriocephalus latus TaxID=60516 RepID=A0A3P6TU36_DIBLA|nr:unnamed protein product [Dibothriocephalus latus]